MSGKMIGLIYFYVVSAASLALIVIGIFNIVNFVVNVTQYDKYPLHYISTDCETNPYAGKFATPAAPEPLATPSAQDLAKQKQLCEQNIETQRRDQKVQDMKNAATFTLVGIVLFAFHFTQARRLSKDH